MAGIDSSPMDGFMSNLFGKKTSQAAVVGRCRWTL